MDTNETQAEQLPQVAVMQSVLKASDLRIGNKLLFLGDVVTFKNITEFREDGIFWIKTFEPKIESKNFHFKPIPLTEDWLLKLGFTEPYKKGYFVLELEDYSYLFFNNHARGYAIKPTEKDGKTLYTYTPLTYVHQLQNLYFALTGSELTVA